MDATTPRYRGGDRWDLCSGVVTLSTPDPGLGRKLTGTRVLVLVADLHVRVLTEDGALLRALTLDPTRDYQPLDRS